MKRDRKPPSQVKRHFPWFTWKFCIGCGGEFIRERGWVFETGPYYNGYGISRYICGMCGPTEEFAAHLRLEYKQKIIDAVRQPPKRP